MAVSDDSSYKVSFAAPRSFAKTLKSGCKETFFPDDPFRQFRGGGPGERIKKILQYFIPIFEWLPNYNLKLFRFDLLAGITITSLAIPQGISYAKLASLPPIIGLYSSFVPPLIYAVFGSSKYIAVGTVAANSLLIANEIGAKASPTDEPELYLHLVFTATLITGLFQACLGFLRLGILVDFLSHSTITGFMCGTATIICLQQLKGMLGLVHFTKNTDVVSVLHSVFENRHEWKWQSALMGIIFLTILQFTRYVRKRKPKLFWVSAIAPIVIVIIGCLFAYFFHAEKHGIQIDVFDIIYVQLNKLVSAFLLSPYTIISVLFIQVGHLRKGLNPISIQDMNFDSEYLPAVVKAALITGLIAMAEGIAIGRSFAIMKNEQIDGNKEMIAFGFMNIVGSFTSCYLTTGPFSKTAVNFNAGCRTAMSNVVMAVGMMLTLLFLAPIFSYTPLVALSAIIMSAMLGLIDYEEIYHLLKVDKFDFCICMTGFLGVAFISMDYGLSMSFGLAVLRALLYVARPATCKLRNIPNSNLYRDTEQYPGSAAVPGVLALQLGSPIYYANSNYIRERVLRWIRDEEANSDSLVEHVILDLTGVSSIDMTGIETLLELRRMLGSKEINMKLVNPRLEVMEKMIRSKFVDRVGKDSIFLCIDDAVEASLFSLKKGKSADFTTGWSAAA